MLTVEEMRTAVPAHLKGAVSQELCDRMNALGGTEPEVAEAIRETIIGHTKVLAEGKFKIEDYAQAAAFVSFRMMGYNNQESYARAFPQRYQGLVARGASTKEISSYVAAYSKGKLVNLVLEQAMTPVWVTNQDVFQKAVQEQLAIMLTAKSEMVRMQAANSLMTHLKPPEKKQLDVNLNLPGEASGLDELKNMMAEIATRQIALIDAGIATREIAHQPLVGAFRIIDVTPAEPEEGNIP